MGLTLEMMVSKDSFCCKLEKQMDFDWLIERLKPYFPDIQDRTSAPVQALCLIMLEHLEPYAPRSEGKPFLASIYENWFENVAYMWLLQAVPEEIPVYKAISTFGSIPAFEEIFYPVADLLPQKILYELLIHILSNCTASHIAAEHPDQPLYYMNRLSRADQDTEIERLANEYTEQFYKSVSAYRDWKGK